MRVDSVKKYGGKRRGVALKALPNEGRKTDDILKMIEDVTKGSYKYFKDGGNVSGTVYNNETSHWDFLS